MATSKDNDDLKIFTPEGRVAFSHVWEPHSFEAGKQENYSLILVFEPGTDLTEMKKACIAAAKKKFGDKASAMFKNGKLKMPWRDGSEYSEYGDPFVEGATFVTLKSKNAPGIVDHNAKPILKQMDFYSGCLARASCLCWAFDQMGNQGVTLLLNNVQKVGDGERMSGRMNAEDEFKPVPKKGAPAGKGGAASFDDDDIPF